MQRIRVLIADDHPIYLEGLKTFLTLEDPSIEVVATAANGKEAVEREREHSPDIVLLDIRMPVMDGLAAAAAMRARRGDVKIIMLTTFDDRELIAEALRSGAKGYLLKDARADEVIRALKTVHSGHLLILDEAADQLLRGDAAGSPASPAATPAARAPRPVPAPPPRFSEAPYGQLTEREREILGLMARGKVNAEIAEELYISEKTVRNYVSRIYEILGVHARGQAIRWAIDRGM